MLLRHRPKDGKLLGVGPLGPSVARRFRLTTENVFLIFGVLAPVQILAGVLFPNAGPRGNLWWLVLAAFLVTAYFATRAFAVWPFGKIEELDAMGLLSKGVEVLTIISLVVLLRLERGSGTQAAAGTLAGAKS